MHSALRRAFELSPTEVRLIEALVALELAPRVRQAAAAFLDKNKDGMATVELVEALVYRRTRDGSDAELAADGSILPLSARALMRIASIIGLSRS